MKDTEGEGKPGTCQLAVREAARKKISELPIDKGGGGEERLLWEKMLIIVIKFACLSSQTLRQAKKSINI